MPTPLADALYTKAEADRIDPIRLISNLLPAIGTLLGGRTSVVVKKGINEKDHWIEHPVVWCLDCSPPSTGKSPSQRAIFAPIMTRQKRADKEYQIQVDRLNEMYDDWQAASPDSRASLRGGELDPNEYKKNMVERSYVVDVGEFEAMLRHLATQPPMAGTCWAKDELTGLFSGLDQYKGGKGNGRQTLLSAWNGQLETRVRRASEGQSFSFNGQTLCINGGIQPDKARQLFSLQDDPDGMLSRVLPCIPQIPDNFAVWSETSVDLYSYLDSVYTALERIPQKQFNFDGDAQKTWRKRWEQMRAWQLKHLETKPSFSYFLGKQGSYVPRFALILHCLEAACSGSPPINGISVDTLTRAIALSNYYCGQFLLLLSFGASEEGKLSGDLLKIWQAAKKEGGSITRRKIQNAGFARRRKWKSVDVAQKFEAIASLGLARIEGKNLILLESDRHDLQIAETQAVTGSKVAIARSTPDLHDLQNSTQTPQNGAVSVKKNTMRGDFGDFGENVETVDHVDQMSIARSTPQTQSLKGSQPFVDHVDRFLEIKDIKIGSEWSVNGAPVIISRVSQPNLEGFTIARNEEPSRYCHSIKTFRDYCDGPRPAPDWLRAIAQAGDFVDVGEQVEHVGDPIPALQYYPQPWEVYSVQQGKVFCRDAKGNSLPKLNQRDLKAIRPWQQGDHPGSFVESGAIATG
ncbi:MAG: DUF3987 domain-containing protein [Cyanophyceae cyanobacterium]